MQIMRLPGWGLSYCDAGYYGWRHSLHIGPFLIFWRKLTPIEIWARGDGGDQ